MRSFHKSRSMRYIFKNKKSNERAEVALLGGSDLRLIRPDSLSMRRRTRVLGAHPAHLHFFSFALNEFH